MYINIQIIAIFKWIKEDLLDSDKDIILLGDFNCLPGSREYEFILSMEFVSSYKEINTQEPEITFPTGITGPHMDIDPPGTFDYIWYKGNHLKVGSSSTFGEE